MSGQETTTAESAAAGPGRRPAIGSRSPGSSPRQTAARRPWWIWVAPFALVLAVLVVRSRFLFTASFYEQGDAGANSILIQQAMHGTLLIGNYSREGFNHPGPAYMYVQAAGQWLFFYALHLVPTAWNAHVLAVFVLNSAFVAMVTGMVYGWTRSLRGAAVALAVLLGFIATEPQILSLDWMPWMYVPAYIAFLVAAASVAAGAARDLWILTLTGWFLIHGHACFLFFVPVILAGVLAAVIWQHGPRASLRAFLRPRTWIPVAVISAVFALPIVVNLALHWPGSFGKYFSYSSSSRAGGHGLTQVVRYALWFWWHGRPHVGGGAGAGGVVRGRDRRGVVADARCDAPVPGRPARRQRGLHAGLRLLRRRRDRHPVALLHRLLLLLRADPHAAGHRGGRGARPARAPGCRARRRRGRPRRRGVRGGARHGGEHRRTPTRPCRTPSRRSRPRRAAGPS